MSVPREITEAWPSDVAPEDWTQVGEGEIERFHAPHPRCADLQILAVYLAGHVACSNSRRDASVAEIERTFTALNRRVRDDLMFATACRHDRPITDPGSDECGECGLIHLRG